MPFDFNKLFSAIAQSEQALLPVFIHNPQSQAIAGAVLLTEEIFASVFGHPVQGPISTIIGGTNDAQAKTNVADKPSANVVTVPASQLGLDPVKLNEGVPGEMESKAPEASVVIPPETLPPGTVIGVAKSDPAAMPKAAKDLNVKLK